MTDDVVFADVALGERFEGPAVIRAFVEDMTQSFSTDVTFPLGQMVVATDEAYAAEWMMAGTHDRSDPIPRVAAVCAG